jgi:putative ABC transport system substrate-binding protein
MKTVRAALLILLALSVLALASEAQQAGKVPRVGFLTWGPCPSFDSVFGIALRELGYVWGQTVHVVCRSAEGNLARLSEAAVTLAAERVDVIAALTHVTAYAAHRVSKSTPIVMIASGDPVGTGLVASLGRPGGNVTGLSYYATELVEKRLEMLKEMVPGATRVAVLANPDTDHVFGLYRNDARRAARSLGLDVLTVDVSHPGDLDRAFDAVSKGGAQGLLVLTDPMLSAEARLIAELATKHRLPAVYWAKWFVEAGGLAAYAADFDYMIRRAALYVDKILKGTKPSDLPIEQPTKFSLILNLKTAKALGLTIPPSLLLRADQVIE